MTNLEFRALWQIRRLELAGGVRPWLQALDAVVVQRLEDLGLVWIDDATEAGRRGKVVHTTETGLEALEGIIGRSLAFFDRAPSLRELDDALAGRRSIPDRPRTAPRIVSGSVERRS